jgi:nucleoid-associated protein YgaU
MSKDVVIAGAIVAACLGLVTVAFVLPKHKSTKAVDSATPSIADNPSAPDTSPITPTPFPDPPGSGSTDIGPIAINPPTSTPPSNFGPGGPLTSSQSPQSPGFHPQPLPGPTPLPQITQTGPLSIEPPAPGAGDVKTHTVAAGETLGEISMKYYGTSKNWKKIAEANKVDPSGLKPGQKLTIPVIEGAAKPGKDAQPEAKLADGEHAYKVKVGDSYYNIAKKELGNASRWKELEKLNGIPAEELHAGQTIKLPNKEATTPNAPPGADATAPAAGNGRVHVVAAGDTLAEISKKYFGTTTRWKDIVKANPGVDPEALKVGQKLNLPEGAAAAPAGAAAASTPAESDAADYVVKAGDTPDTIAQHELGSKKEVKRLLDANPGLDAKHLRIGQKIKIPGKTKPTEPITPAPSPGSFGSPPAFGSPQGAPTSPGAFTNPNPGFGMPPGLGPTPALPPAPGSAQPGGAFGTPSYPPPPVPPTASPNGQFGSPTPNVAPVPKSAFTQ